MPWTILVVVFAVTVSYLRRGRLARIADANLAWTWLLFSGLLLQAGLEQATARSWIAGAGAYLPLLASQVLVLIWVLRNWWRPGMVLIGLGLLLNAIVMAANGAMPVDPDAVVALGVEDVPAEGFVIADGKHVMMTDETRVPWLADVFPLPPIRTIISVGDIVLAAGLVPLVHHLMTYRPPVERRGGPRREHAVSPG